MIKELNRKSPVDLQRFAIEVEAMRNAGESGIDNVVPILDYNLKSQPPWYSMPLYEGHLDGVLGYTRGNVQRTARLMLPIAETLRKLCHLPRPIYHRDLKPANILYKTVADNPILHLADFGCAFFESGDSERLTDIWRPVGAGQYRPPEYSYGRVEKVTASGDVYALGKILWYLCNGIRGDIFPYTLWYPEQYNLTRRIQGEGVSAMSYLIAQCANTDAERRPSYDTLVAELSRLTSPEAISMPDTDAQTRMLEFEARNRELREQEIEKGALLIRTIREDLDFVAARLSVVYQGTDLIRDVGALTARNEDPKQVLKGAIERNQALDLFWWHFPIGRAVAHVYRPNPSGRLPFRERYISIILERYGHGQTELHIGDVAGGLVMINSANVPESGPYSRAQLATAFLDFFRKMTAAN